MPQLDRLSVRRGRVRDAAPELRCCGGGAPSGDAQGRCRALFCGIRRSAVSKLPEKVYFWSSEASPDALDAGFRPCQSLPTPSPIRSAGHSSGGVFARRGIPSAGHSSGGAFLRRTSLWTATSASDAVNGAARRGCGREAELPPPARFAPVRFAAGPYRSVPVRPVGPARTRSVPVRPGPGSAGGGAKCEQFDLKGNKRQWMR